MSIHPEDMHKLLDRIYDAFPEIRTSDIPGIDLYMDQVTTFLQDNLRGLSRDPEGDKFLTKTMINNYVKNKVLIPPVKKKYSRDHMMLLIMIYYMKSFLSIGDIRSITAPVMERYAAPAAEPADRKKDAARIEAARKEAARKDAARRDAAQKEAIRKDVAAKDPAAKDAFGKEPSKGETADLRIRDIYESIAQEISEDLPRIRKDIADQIDFAADDFAGVPEEDRPLLQRFSLICRLSAEVYMRKLFIEKLLDEEM